ncbi:magnesium transporter [Neptunicoccus cionae]|uniref:Magnesium transporter MgtE n=1 Tax=Neptunicoccus cionae TaxID=2035344 RepID=A0A916VMY8_9RHOB|nr:magnesium transporter [Amylibacter cionae]GGA09536.1 magnesium transporter MgtE [Amylibacter cionae]
MQDQITPDDAFGGPDAGDGAYALDTVAIDAILESVEAGDQSRLIELLAPLHSADIADVLEQISGAEREALLGLWGTEFDGDVLSELDENLRADLIETLPADVMSSALKDLESDDVVDLVEDLEQLQQTRVLDALEQADRVVVEQSLQYPEESAGRLMQRELVMAPAHWTVGDAIDHLRSENDLPYRFYVVVIVDPKMQPIGKVALSDLMSSPRDTMLATIMDEHFHVIPVTQTQEDVAYAFNQYHMVSAPVVDEEGRLVGVITIDDAMLVLDEEAEEDLRLLNGVGDESLTDSVLDTTRQRFPWLGVNLITAVLASVVISQFSDTIEAIVALAVLMPIVASMGGNAGTQTLTVAVRALATKDLTASNAMRVIRREVMVGLLNGLVFAVIIGVVGVVWFGSAMLGVVLGLAMIANLLIAGMAGILIPITLTKLKIDPALASGAFVTTVTDVVGFFAFLGLAAVMLT